MKTVFCCLLLCLLFAACTEPTVPVVKPGKGAARDKPLNDLVGVYKYNQMAVSGTWAAKYPTAFNTGCAASNYMAIYNNGDVEFWNCCYDNHTPADTYDAMNRKEQFFEKAETLSNEQDSWSSPQPYQITLTRSFQNILGAWHSWGQTYFYELGDLNGQPALKLTLYDYTTGDPAEPAFRTMIWERVYGVQPMDHSVCN